MIELLKNHPKSAELLRNYYSEKMKENVPLEFHDIMKNFPTNDEMISKLVGDNYRALFDFFDENNIFIETICYSSDKSVEFNCHLYPLVTNIGWVEKRFKKRKEAEKYAISRAFELLEQKL